MNGEYFKLDVNIGDHAKVVDLGDTAFRLYVLSIGYANRHMTDGFIATSIARRLVDPDPHGQGWDWKDHADELVRHELWHEVDGGYQIHDFADHNTPRDERLRKRREDADRKAAWRAGRKAEQTGPDGPSNRVPRDKDGTRTERPTGQSGTVPSTRAPGSAGDDSVNDRDSVNDSVSVRGEHHVEPSSDGAANPGPADVGTQAADATPDPPDARRLCDLLADRIASWTGKPRPAVKKTWVTAARLLLTRDDMTVAEVEQLIVFATSSDFWRSNILSMPKLREKRLMLLGQVRRVEARASPNGRPAWQDHAERRYAEALAREGGHPT